MSETTTITLHAASEGALNDERVRATVEAAARALAERYGIEVVRVESDGSALAVTLKTDEVTAVGYAAELRRSTGGWYEGRYGAGPLWRTPSGGGE